MKKFIFILCIGFISINVFSADKKNSQANNNPSIVYSLPKTELVIKVTAKQTIQEAGPYAEFAEKMLGIKNAIKENKTFWEVSKIEVKPEGNADPSRTFQLTNGYISLNDKGVITGINNYTYIPLKHTEKELEAQDVNLPEDFAILEDQITPDSLEKKAQKAANLIFSLRGSRIDLITAETERMPADGEALKTMLKRIDLSEQQLLELFTGKTKQKTISKEFVITPKNISKEILFRLSDQTGITDKDAQYGNPYYLSISLISNETPSVKIKEKEINKGCFYLLPGLAKLVVNTNESEVYKEDIEISQGGSLQKIPEKTLKDDKIRIEYNPITGALKRIGK
jgi:hypothetical protein